VKEYHRPVLLSEVLQWLDPKPGDVFVDCTLGGAGHSKVILSRILPGGHLVGIDRDSDAIEQAGAELAEFADSVTLARGDFGDLARILGEVRAGPVKGVLFDLGVSSHQLDTPERGFSFSAPAPLDMRMDQAQPTTAGDLVNGLSERELAQLIFVHSDERWAARIAKAIVERRQKEPISTTSELAEIVRGAIPAKFHPPKTHPATRTFQALRIAVNTELESLQAGLEAAVEALAGSGRIAVISYHSLEDRIVKQFFAAKTGRCQCPPAFPQCVCGAKETLRVLTRKPVLPTPEETEENPRARSAKLRVAERVDPA
jgi:16S rRNA (cytosine1402-N4)-methyltransferase